jgi:hypothetical protein
MGQVGINEWVMFEALSQTQSYPTWRAGTSVLHLAEWKINIRKGF